MPTNPNDAIVYSTVPTLGAGSIEVWPESQFQGFDSLSSTDVASLAAIFTSPIAVPAVPNPLPAKCTGFNPTS